MAARQVNEESDFQDPLQQPCSEKNLADIAKELNSWESVYAYLDLTKPEADTIRRNSPHDHEYQKLEVLNRWKLKKGKFQGTFKALINVFSELHNQHMVDTIRNVAAKAHQVQSDTLVVELQDDFTAVDFDKLEAAATSLGLLSDAVKDTLGIAANDVKKKDVILDVLTNLPKPQLIDYVLRVAALDNKEGKPQKVPLSQTAARKADKPAHLDQMFRQTVNNIRVHFRRCDVEDLIINFNMTVHADNIPCISVKVKETLCNCKTEKDLFLKLSPYITWSKRDVLQALVEASEIEEAKLELQKFENQIDPNWLINDLPLPTVSPSVCPDTKTSGMTMVAVTAKKNLNMSTLGDVEGLQETVAQSGGISKDALDLQAKNIGSSVFYWLLPQIMVKTFEDNIRRNLNDLYNEGIVEIALDPNIVITTGPQLRIRALSYLTKLPSTTSEDEMKEYSGNVDEVAELYRQLKVDIEERDKRIMTLEADLKGLEQDKAAAEQECGSLKEELNDTLEQLHGTIEGLQSSPDLQPFPMELDTVTSKQPVTSASGEEDMLVVGTRGHHVVKWRESLCISGGYTELDHDQYCPQLYYPASQAYCWPSTNHRLLPPSPVKWFSPIVIDDKLVTIGGVDNITGQPTNKLYCWNESMQQWEELFPAMITPRLFATSALYQSYLIVIGGAYDVNASDFGNDVEVLDVSSKQWYRAESLPKPSGNKQAVIIDDTLFLLSGWLPKLKDTSAWCCCLPQLLESAHGVEFHISKKSKLSTVWKAMEPPLPTSAIAAVGKYLVAVGGWEAQNDSPSDTIQYYHPGRATAWRYLKNLEHPRAAGAAIACSEDKVLVFGGRVGASLYSTTIEHITMTI